MDSPEPNRTTVTSPPASSPAVQESPFFNYLSNLSPIRSGKAVRYVQRFSQTDLPIPLPVFTSPRIDMDRQACFLKRGEIVAAGPILYGQCDVQMKSGMISCTQKEVCLSSPSGCIDEYLADPTDFTDLCVHPDKDDSVDRTGKDFLPSASANFVQIERVSQFMEFEGDVFPNPFSGAQHHGRFTVEEEDQQQRGIRRHLQFGTAMACKRTDTESHDTDNLSLFSGLKNFDNPVQLQVEPKGISSGCQGGVQTVASQSSFCPSESVRSAQYLGNHAISAFIPSALGLHLNSFVRSVSMVSASTASKHLAGNLNHNLAKDLDCNSASSVTGEIYTHVRDDDQHESEATATIGFASCQPPSLVPPCNSLHVTPFEQQAAPDEGSMQTSQNAEMVEELNHASPVRNRKKAKYTENDGCKRCNCKRSKCLKLYCECFAAGIYCLDSCSCKTCFNKPDYEDTVLDTRQQIEARNPMAFAPKVINQANNSPANLVEEGNLTTPSSARHKRGCNCKKSKCLKKYCECYQARVGCSDGCRCEGCDNSFGKKSGERLENPSHQPMTPLSHSHSGTLATSASLNISNSSTVSRARSSCYLNWRHSPTCLTPKLYGREGLLELSSDSFLDDFLLEDYKPMILKNTSTPTKAVKVSSPNQKRVSPQIRLQDLRSSSSQALRIGRKFMLQAVPSFPPLTPYTKLKDGIKQNDDDHKASSPN